MAECVSTDGRIEESSMEPSSVCFICERFFDRCSEPIPICPKCRSILKALCTCSVSNVDDLSGVIDIPL
jgi:hypothetical protein